MRVLLLGSGGREHALAWKLAQSPRLTALYAAPGNAGIARLAETVALDITDHAAVVSSCRALRIDLVVIGPEAPLVAGLADDLEAAGIRVFGPSRAAARLEGSKAFTKELCRRHDIPTAASETFRDPVSALAHLRHRGAPVVVKADGLAAGKGVRICLTEAEAVEAIADCFSGLYGDAGSTVILEDRLEGEEASFFALCDGRTALPLATAQDHKRAYDGDTGPNTGGMGAYSPAPVMTPALERRTMDEIVRPTLHAMAEAGTPFRGVLYAGLMITATGPKLIEYNVRFGDPECQALMLRLKSDLLPLLEATADGTVAGQSLEWRDVHALTVAMASRGYPGDYRTGAPIGGLDEAEKVPGVTVFHAGTRCDGPDRVVSAGGRVLNVSAVGSSLREARDRAYEAVQRIDWADGFYRTDIGIRALSPARAA